MRKVNYVKIVGHFEDFWAQWDISLKHWYPLVKNDIEQGYLMISNKVTSYESLLNTYNYTQTLVLRYW